MPPKPLTEEDLKPFDPDRLCPKCGFVNDTAWPKVAYCWEEGCESEGLAVESDGEHMHQTCGLCGFDWPVLPLSEQMLKELETERDNRLKEQERLEQEQTDIDLETQKVNLQQAKKPKSTTTATKKASARPVR